MQVAVGAGELAPPRRPARAARSSPSASSASHMLVSQTSARSCLSSAALSLTKPNRWFEPHSSSPSIIMVIGSGSAPVTALKARQASTKVITWPLSSQAPRATMILRPSGSVRDARRERRRLPQVERIDRLHVVMAVEQHAAAPPFVAPLPALPTTIGWPSVGRTLVVEAEAGEVLGDEIGRRLALVLDRPDRSRSTGSSGTRTAARGCCRDRRRSCRGRREELRTVMAWQFRFRHRHARQLVAGHPRLRCNFKDVDGRNKSGHDARCCAQPERRIYRRRMPPSVPRTMARPIVLPIEPPIDLPRSAAIWPATRLVTERVDLARDQLAGRQPLVRAAGWCRRCRRARRRCRPACRRCHRRRWLPPGLSAPAPLPGAPIGAGAAPLHALLQHLVGGFGIDRPGRICPCTGLLAMTALRSSGVIGPTRADGGRIMQRSTIDGRAVAFQERDQRLALAELA